MFRLSNVKKLRSQTKIVFGMKSAEGVFPLSMNRTPSSRPSPPVGGEGEGARRAVEGGLRPVHGGRELERGEPEKRPPLPGPLLLFWGGEGEGLLRAKQPTCRGPAFRDFLP